MNERLNELRKLARKEVWGNNQYNGAPEFEGWDLDAEKFAELIIKETMQVVAKNVAWNGYLNAAEAVIEHFKDEE
jgi:hypothetical protein